MGNNYDKIVSITELRRNFGALTEDLPEIEELILTKGGEPYATLRAVPGEKMKILKKSAGTWKNTKLNSNLLWKGVFYRKSRRSPIKI